MDPKQGSNVVKAVRLAKDHTYDEKEDACLVKGLVNAKAVVLALIEIFDALLLVDGSIDDPILGHIPLVLKGKINERVESKRNKAAEERLEFSHAAALQDKAGLLTPAMNFLFKNKACY